MDWYLNATDAQAVSALRREIGGYLARHASQGDTFAAEVVVSELLGNVTRHAPGPCWVSLTWTTEAPELTVYDLGPGFDPRPVLERAGDEERLYEESGRGLFLVSAMAPRFAAASRQAGGSKASATLPVRRRAEQSFNLDRQERVPSLPSLDERSPSGGFAKEPFLRALVVELAQAIERTAGPVVSEQVVSEVGTGVGAQMEAEYREAKEIVQRLSPEQLADCMVRLKHAIDGNFRVVELTKERIVFANTRCPFGDAVKRAPALCRMTSSVFGGIAARNVDSGTAEVVLEERIAVGDPECRVVVRLTGSEGAPAFAHRYSA